MKTPAQRWMGKVARVPCVLCQHMGLGETPAEVHHMKHGSGACNQTSDFLTIALCTQHHRVEYPSSVHALKERGMYQRFKLSEVDLLAMTIEAVERMT